MLANILLLHNNNLVSQFDKNFHRDLLEAEKDANCEGVRFTVVKREVVTAVIDYLEMLSDSLVVAPAHQKALADLATGILEQNDISSFQLKNEAEINTIYPALTELPQELKDLVSLIHFLSENYTLLNGNNTESKERVQELENSIEYLTAELEKLRPIGRIASQIAGLDRIIS